MFLVYMDRLKTNKIKYFFIKLYVSQRFKELQVAISVFGKIAGLLRRKYNKKKDR